MSCFFGCRNDYYPRRRPYGDRPGRYDGIRKGPYDRRFDRGCPRCRRFEPKFPRLF